MMDVTVFDKILKKEIPSTVVFENANVIAFKDTHPLASIHVIFIHKQRSKNISDLISINPQQVADLFVAMTSWAKMQGLDESGYRIVTNQGSDGGQSVFYTHFHLLGGESLGGFGARR